MSRHLLLKMKDLIRCFRPALFEGTERHYDSTYAERMDRFALRPSSQSELDLLLAHRSLDRHTRVLDLGCNTGRIASALRLRTEALVCGIDRNAHAIARARGLHPEGTFVHCDSASLPLPSGSFDHVMINHVIGHVSDPDATLNEVKRVLRPRATVSLVTPNRWYKVGMTSANLWNRYEPDPTVLRYFTKKSLCRLLERNGFDVEVATTTGELAWPFQRVRKPAQLRMRVFALGRSRP